MTGPRPAEETMTNFQWQREVPSRAQIEAHYRAGGAWMVAVPRGGAGPIAQEYRWPIVYLACFRDCGDGGFEMALSHGPIVRYREHEAGMPKPADEPWRFAPVLLDPDDLTPQPAAVAPVDAGSAR